MPWRCRMAIWTNTRATISEPISSKTSYAPWRNSGPTLEDRRIFEANQLMMIVVKNDWRYPTATLPLTRWRIRLRNMGILLDVSASSGCTRRIHNFTWEWESFSSPWELQVLCLLNVLPNRSRKVSCKKNTIYFWMRMEILFSGHHRILGCYTRQYRALRVEYMMDTLCNIWN